jgi:predicted RNase H-like nuclease
MVVGRADGRGMTDVSRVEELAGVMELVDSGELAAVGIDIPIGLPASGSRSCDIEARRLIGGRRNSVFPAPARAVLGAATFEDASIRSRSVTGKGISRQTFGILGKIEDVDLLMTPDRQRHVVEVHPEVCFTLLAGAPMTSHKATPDGRAERLAALRGVFADVDDHAAKPRARVRSDDVLDAFAVAWTARRWWAKTHTQLGGAIDQRGLRMEIIG